jgi:hypothetical protein
MARGVSDGAKLVCSPTAAHSADIFSDGAVSEVPSVGNSISSFVAHSVGTVSSVFVQQLERDRESISPVSTSRGRVFFIK